MTQNAPKQNASRVPDSARPISTQIRQAFLGGASALVLSMPLLSQNAAAEGLQITRQYYPGGSTAVFRRIPDGAGRISKLNNPAPGNNCPVPAFEVVNPGPGEARCVGYVMPSWLTR
ncbi:hypothetical protein [uncultured Bosea sp.]|uniref:hypothetical protein n=1 Tax=uncultured Bosea sp. TaxID=211457 RepID=UPI00263BAC31|nr:hypothetical protein [uncultured Bosea sp.]